MSKYKELHHQNLSGFLPKGWYKEEITEKVNEGDSQLCKSYYSFGNGMSISYWLERYEAPDDEYLPWDVDQEFDIEILYSLETKNGTGSGYDYMDKEEFKEELKRRSSKIWKVMYG